MSMRGWSGALPNEIQSFPTLEDVRGALYQMQCPEGNKETFDDHPLFVSPCILSTSVYLMQERDNKAVQKYCQLRIIYAFALILMFIGEDFNLF